MTTPTPSRAVAAIDKAFKEQTGVVGEVKELTDAITQLERYLAARDAELAAMKQRAEAAERKAEENARDAAELRMALIDAIHGKPCPTQAQWAQIQGLIKQSAAIAAKGEA